MLFGQGVEDVIGRALSRDPARRFPSSTVFATELKLALERSAAAPVVAPVEVADEPPESKWKSLFRFGR
jgi:hypothetical protein